MMLEETGPPDDTEIMVRHQAAHRSLRIAVGAPPGHHFLPDDEMLIGNMVVSRKNNSRNIE